VKAAIGVGESRMEFSLAKRDSALERKVSGVETQSQCGMIQISLMGVSRGSGSNLFLRWHLCIEWRLIDLRIWEIFGRLHPA
jgi:hypothetical protein